MQITHRSEADQTLILEIEGRLDTLTSPEALTQLKNHLQPGASRVLLDASRLDYISSAGLRVLLQINREAQGQLRLANLSPFCREILEVAGLTSVLQIFPDLETARRSE